jgi:hypothetical protein
MYADLRIHHAQAKTCNCQRRRTSKSAEVMVNNAEVFVQPSEAMQQKQ